MRLNPITFSSSFLLLAIWGLISCSGGGDEPADEVEDDEPIDTTFNAPSGEACDASERLGSLSVYLGEDYTSFAGAVSDGVLPSGVPEVLAEEGSCRLLGAPSLFCDPACPGGQSCTSEGTCVPTPSKVSAGVIRVSGLEVPLEESPNGITFDYSETFSDPFPGVTSGSEVVLSAEGDEVPGFSLTGRGIEALTSPVETIAVATDTPATVEWDAPQESVSDVEVHVKLTVNAHGSTSAWVECIFEDTGSAEIPADLVTGVIAAGLSGFPRAIVSRRTMDSVAIDGGCVDFKVSSELTIAVEVPGLVSCSGDEECPDGQTCDDLLTCSE